MYGGAPPLSVRVRALCTEFEADFRAMVLPALGPRRLRTTSGGRPKEMKREPFPTQIQPNLNTFARHLTEAELWPNLGHIGLDVDQL